MSSFPPPPWTLGGWGFATLGFVSSAGAAAFVPAGAHLVTVAPGKTIGGLFFLSYDYGSLVYRELIVAAGLVRVGTRFAFLLPRLYVDSAASLAGGRNIWAVQKELATFEIERAARVTSVDVRQGARYVCRLRCTAAAMGLRIPIPLPSVGVRDDAYLFFTGKLLSTISFARVEVGLPVDSEFSALGLDRPRVAFRCDNLTLAVSAPLCVPRHIERRLKLTSRVPVRYVELEH